MNKSLSPSKFAAECLGLKTEAGKGTEPFACVKCGGEFDENTGRVPYKPASSFTDTIALSHRESEPMECEYCAAFASKMAMMALQDVFISREISGRIKAGPSRRWVLENLHKIEPPWLFLMSDAKLGHLVWRTPLSFDIRRMGIRITSRLTYGNLVRCREIIKALPKGVKPLRYADREVRDIASGAPSKGAIEAGLEEKYDSLTMGDWWILAGLSYDAQPPERPEPLSF